MQRRVLAYTNSILTLSVDVRFGGSTDPNANKGKW